MMPSIFGGFIGGLVLLAGYLFVIGYSSALAMPTIFSQAIESDAVRLFLWDLAVTYSLAIGVVALGVGAWLAMTTSRPFLAALAACATFLAAGHLVVSDADIFRVRHAWTYAFELAVFLYVFGSVWAVSRITSQGLGRATRAPT